jgi:hypothetical protein
MMLITCQLRRLVLAHLNYGASIIEAYAYNSALHDCIAILGSFLALRAMFSRFMTC